MRKGMWTPSPGSEPSSLPRRETALNRVRYLLSARPLLDETVIVSYGLRPTCFHTGLQKALIYYQYWISCHFGI